MRRSLLFSFLVLWTTPALSKEFIVKLRTVDAVATQSLVGATVLESHNRARLVKVEVADAQLSNFLTRTQSNPNVEYMVENFRLVAPPAPPSSLALRNQWSIIKVQAERAWQLAGNKGSRDIKVAVIDTGVDYRHPSLAPNMIPGYDFLGNDSDPMDETGAPPTGNPGHGTHCAGAVGATGLQDQGVVGLAPVVSIMPLRFLGADGGGDLMAGIRAIDHAIDNGAHIISASWGATVSRDQAQPLVEAVQRADAAGVIFIAAAANDGRNNDTTEVYPANSGFPNTITVAASDSSDNKPQWSNFGPAKVHVAAPGAEIMSTLPNNSYGNLSGTSMATPLVSGLVALLKSQRPDLSGAQARALLQTTGAQVNIDVACNCRVDAAEAMTALKENRPMVVPAAASIQPNETLSFTMMNGQAPFQYSSSNTAVATVDQNGLMTAVGQGETQVTVTDANGVSATSMRILVAVAQTEQPGECPIGDPVTCALICEIMPMPFCQ